MKKLLTILLVLLVAGFVFADGDGPVGPGAMPGDASLTLKSSIEGLTVHGFYGGSNAFTNDGITSSAMSSAYVDGQVDMLELESVSQDVGFYSFRSNSATGVKINISASPMTFTQAYGEDSSTTVYVPYELVFATITSGSGNIDGNDYNALSLGSASGSPNTAGIDAVSHDLLNVSTTGGTKWATYALSVTFDGLANEAYGLPEGAYTATVTAKITAN